MNGPPPASARLATLDAARGLAALMVVAFHMAIFVHIKLVSFGGWSFFKKGYLAVDLFFLLSGFVIALSYERKLKSGQMSPGRFLAIRAVRLYPLYLAATLAGLAIWLGSHPGEATPWTLIAMAVAGLPQLAPAPAADPSLFPFNEVGWSLFLEIAVNVLWCLALVRLPLRLLWAVAALAAVPLLATGIDCGSFNFGVDAREFGDALPRVMVSFTLGLIVCRSMDEPWFPRLEIPAVALLAALGLALGLPLGFSGLEWDAGFVFFGVPLFVALGCRAEPPAALRGLFGELGRLSYAIYLVHMPCIRAVDMVWRGMAGQPVGDSPLAGAAAIFALVLASSYALTSWFDEPLRAMLGRRLMPGPAAAAAPPQPMASTIPARFLQAR